MNIGIIAHDNKKKLLQNFCIAYQNILIKHSIFATGSSGRLVEQVTDLKIHKFLAGHLGGIEQIAAQIEENSMDLIIFLRDPIDAKAHEPSIDKILKLCDLHNIPVATNVATAELLIKSLDRGDLEWRNAYR